MKTLLAALAAFALLTGAAAAQNTPAPDLRTDREVRLQCQGEARLDSPRGKGRKSYMTACLLRERPGLLKADQCRQAGKSNGLIGPQLNAYVKSCVASG